MRPALALTTLLALACTASQVTIPLLVTAQPHAPLHELEQRRAPELVALALPQALARHAPARPRRRARERATRR